MPSSSTGWLPIVIGAGLVLNGARLRRRLRQLDTLPASERPVDPRHEFLVARGAHLSAAARRAASHHASRERLDVLDLVPADLTVERVLDLARTIDTRTYRKDRAVFGRGAFEALLVDADLLRRAGIDQRDDFDPLELVDVTERLKRYASTTMDLAVVPELTAARIQGAKRIKIQARVNRWQPANTVLPLARDIGIGVGLVANPPAGLASAALFWLQPFFVCAGRVPLQPGDLVRSPVVRITAGFGLVASTVRARRERAAATALAGATGRPAEPAEPADEVKKAIEAARAYYGAQTAAGFAGFFEPPSEHCYWCGSRDLSTRFVSPDLYLRKPGRFRYVECGSCGHVFQNPRLSPAGLDFYYRDCYDGLAVEIAEVALGSQKPAFLARAELMRSLTQPRAWLDVGAGHGHFCNQARDVWPDTVFDGLDMTDGIDEARRRGWVDRAHRGMFPELVDDVAGRYDVISMFHYLEHTTDPLAELDAAAKALPPGGHLFIELPNPDSPAARLLGRFWVGWFVPQHLHMMSADNLIVALTERGLSPVTVQFGPSHQAGVTAGAVVMLLQRMRPIPWLPWLPKPASAGSVLAWGLTVAGLTPVFVAGGVLDVLTLPYFRRGQRATAFRVIARKDL